MNWGKMWHTRVMRNRHRNSSHLCFFLALICALFFSTAVRSEMTYFINGKQVSSATYRAGLAQNEAVSLMKENRTREAIAKLRNAIAFDPRLAEVHSLMGVALSRAGKMDEAIEQFKLALQEDDHIVTARLNLASLYQSTGRLSEAMQMYQQFLREFPDSKQIDAVKDRMAIVSKELKKESEAEQHVDDGRSYFSNVIVQGTKRWPEAEMPLKVYIRDGEGLSDYRPEYDSILRQSFSEWEKVSQGKVRFTYVNSPAQADITCIWVDDQSAMSSSAEGGETNVNALSHSLTKAKIMLSLTDEGAFPLTANLVRVLALHEIGHALGLLGHSARASDVMYCTAPIVDVERHLSNRDVNTLAALYAQDVDPISLALFKLDRETHGHAIDAVRAIIMIITAIACTVIVLSILFRKKRRPKKSSKSIRA